MDIETKIAIFEDKIQEYYLSCLLRGIRSAAVGMSLDNWPLYKFNICSIYKSICVNRMVPKDLLGKCADKLIDIKLMYCYIDTTDEHFYRGPTLVVGNNQLEKLNPNTMSMLRENHYKVYLLSVIIENLLDFFEIIFQKRVSNYKKNKWEKILEATKELNAINAINEENIRRLLAFKNKYRTAELHEFSAVRAFTAHNEWDHFQIEINIVRDILADMTCYFTQRKP